jgi:NADH dehydrogenase
MRRKKVVIVGGGFGGLAVAKSLRGTGFDITLIDKRNHHVFQPLLYQVATSSLSPAEIAYPLRSTFRSQPNVRVLLGNVVKIDRLARTLTLKSGQTIGFDILVVGAGARHAYFGHDEWAKYALGLKTLRDALKIRERMLLSFERAEASPNAHDRKKYLTFVIVGAGPTGVEMAGAIAEIAQKTLIKDFRSFDPRDTRIVLVEAGDRVLPRYSPRLSEKAKEALEKLGVEVRLNAMIKNVTETGVQINEECLPTTNVIWAAGNMASPLVQAVTEHRNRAGQALVNPDFSIPEDPYIFCIGDCAYLEDGKGKPVPAIAPAAIQAGNYVAHVLKKDLPPEQRKSFVYADRGNMATIGKAQAVAQIYGLEFWGLLAWLMWSLIHIVYLIDFRSKFFVLVEWAWGFLTYNRSVRLISTYREREHQ